VTAADATFVPGPGRKRAFRDALGRFATGVTVVTCEGDGPLGITANSFTSVSLDPPLVLWSPARSSRRFNAFVEAEHFAVHVMGEEQADIALGFAMEGDAFDGLSVARNEEGVPIIHGCLARFECRTHARHDGGDHEIVVGAVLRASSSGGAPLIFAGGSYGRFTSGP
jgi:flavin reductase (DIM6/NTAB) family NADH-FMN oxidoreductase RutF